MKRYIILSFVILNSVLVHSQTEYIVQPNTADPLSGAPNNNHFVYINQTISAKNKLFLFFPGTFAVPFNYRKILKHAANIGYHSIGLTYANNQAINSICATTIDTTCHSRARLEVFDGKDRHADLEVDTNNCIKGRTLKLLQYLNSNYPAENWSQYYTADEINWDKIIVSGHSQGGGHAGIIAKVKQVERVLMFAAMDWISLLNRNADWITWNSLTPEEKYYGLAHKNDELVDFSNTQTTWNNYGMSNFGNIILVDTSNSPYNNSRMLYTLEIPDNDSTKFHSCMVADAYTPIDTGIPVFSPVWTYMIEGNKTTLSLADISSFSDIKAYPNPVSSILNFSCSDSDNYKYSIHNLKGQKVEFGYLKNKSINISNLVEGFYFIKIQNGHSSKTYKILKE